MHINRIEYVYFRAPRFLLKQMMRTDPDKNLLYQHLKRLKPPSSVDPNPPTATLLPLRPKTCQPKMRQEFSVTSFEVCLFGKYVTFDSKIYLLFFFCENDVLAKQATFHKNIPCYCSEPFMLFWYAKNIKLIM